MFGLLFYYAWVFRHLTYFFIYLWNNFMLLLHIVYVTLITNMRPLSLHSALENDFSKILYDIGWEQFPVYSRIWRQTGKSGKEQPCSPFVLQHACRWHCLPLNFASVEYFLAQISTCAPPQLRVLCRMPGVLEEGKPLISWGKPPVLFASRGWRKVAICILTSHATGSPFLGGFSHFCLLHSTLCSPCPLYLCHFITSLWTAALHQGWATQLFLLSFPTSFAGNTAFVFDSWSNTNIVNLVFVKLVFVKLVFVKLVSVKW